MNSESLQEHLAQASRAANVDPNRVSMLRESLACYFDLLARSIDATRRRQRISLEFL